MSEFRVEVVRIGPVTKHPNADTLSVTEVLGGYPCIFKTGDFAEGDLATYVPVDALVPVERPEFKFLDEGKGKSHARVRARKLRGVFSMGLLVPAPRDSHVGDDVQALYEVDKWVPPAEREDTSQKHNADRKAKPSETLAFELRARGVAASLAVLALCVSWKVCLPASALLAIACELLIRWKRAVTRKPCIPVYDIEGLRKYPNVFQENEPVCITEKIHGCNARFVHTGKKFHVASRTRFREDSRIGPGLNTSRDTKNLWWAAARKYGLEKALAKCPGFVLFGEIYGADCQDLDYGIAPGDIGFAAFDLMDLKTREYLGPHAFAETCRVLGIPTAPTLYVGPWNQDVCVELAEGKTTLGGKHVREGIVIKPEEERSTPGLGRTFLKWVGEGYHLRKGAP